MCDIMVSNVGTPSPMYDIMVSNVGTPSLCMIWLVMWVPILYI